MNTTSKKNKEAKILSFKSDAGIITTEIAIDKNLWTKIYKKAQQELGKQLKASQSFPKGKELPQMFLDKEINPKHAESYAMEFAYAVAYDLVAKEKSVELDGYKGAEQVGKIVNDGVKVEIAYYKIPSLTKLPLYKEMKFNTMLEQPGMEVIKSKTEMMKIAAGKKIESKGPVTSDFIVHADLDIKNSKTNETIFADKNVPLWIGLGRFLPEFERELIGLKHGDQKDFVSPFILNPQLPNEKTDCNFKVVIVKLEKREPISMSELLKLEKVTNEKELNKKIAEQLLFSRYQGPLGVDMAKGEMIADQIADISEFDISDKVIDKEFTEVKKSRFESIEKQTKKPIQEFAKTHGKTVDELTALLRKQYVDFFKNGLIVQRIAATEKLVPKHEAVKDFAEKQKISESHALDQIMKANVMLFLAKNTKSSTS